MDLTDRQIEAIEHHEGPCRVLAGPGSGKTTVLSHRYAYLTRDLGYPVSRILTITFTSKAGQEMRDRCQQASDLYPKRDQQWIGTMHSMFRRVHEAEFGEHRILTEEERQGIIFDIQKQGYRYLAQLHSTDILDLIDRWRLAMIEPDQAFEIVIAQLRKDGHDEVADLDHIPVGEVLTDEQAFAMGCRQAAVAYHHYQRIKQDSGAIDFTDMVYETWRMLKGAGSRLRRRWSGNWDMIMVDEFQDVDRCQLDILKMLSEDHRNLFVVGDDDQAVYGFRGATPDIFIDFEKTFDGARTIVLDRNFRSPDELVRRGCSMIAKNTERVPKLVRGLDETADVSFTRPGTSKREASDVVTRIKTLNADGVPLGEIAIIYRTNELSLPFEMALEKEKILFSVRHGGTFFDLKEINPLVRYLEIVSRQHTWASLEAIANWPNRHLPRDVVQAWKCNSSRDVLECLEASLTGDPLKDKGIKRLRDDLTYLIANADGKTTLGLLDLIVEHVNYLSTASSIHGFRGPDDPGLQELLGQLEDACEAEPDPREFLARVRRSREFARRRRKRDNAVQLVTFHSVKGLEFEAVFLTGMSEGVMPHKRSIADDDIEEERRLAYVGWTRSKRAVHVSSPIHIGKVSRFAVEWGVTNPLSGRATSSTFAEQPSAPSTSNTGSPELT